MVLVDKDAGSDEYDDEDLTFQKVNEEKLSPNTKKEMDSYNIVSMDHPQYEEDSIKPTNPDNEN